jgi:hypothetical protein
MKIILRLLSGVISAFLGGVVAFTLDLFVGNGIQLNPISEFIFPLATGGIIGFLIGVIFYKPAVMLFGFLGRFSVELFPQ